MTRDNERITELLADAEKNMRHLLFELNDAGAPWQLLRGIIDMGGNLSQGLGLMDEQYYDGRCASGAALAGYPPHMRPVHIPEETAKQIKELHRTFEDGIAQILGQGAATTIANESEEETLIEPQP